MLVLSRKPGESITVLLPSGDEIVFKVLDQFSNRTSVGIEAPREFRVLRTELPEKNLEWEKRGAK